MAAKCVLLVGEPSLTAGLRLALAALGFPLRECLPSDAVNTARAEHFDLVVVAPLANGAAARFVAHLGLALKAACPPVVAVLTNPDLALRDQCLLSGALDACLEATAEELRTGVATACEGWRRSGARYRVDPVVTARRGRQESFELRVEDLDASGLGLASADGVQPGELLRLPVPLPGLDLLAWGRVTARSDGLGVRFVGLSAMERARLLAALGSCPAAPAPARARGPAATHPGLAGQLPVSPPQRPAPPLEVPAERAAPQRGDPAAASDLCEQGGPGHGTSPGEAPDPRVPAAPHEQSASEDRWPLALFDPALTQEALSMAVSMGLVAEEPGAPSGDYVIEFARQLSPFESRYFGPEPPAELPGVDLARRGLALRLLMGAIQREGDSRLATSGGRPVVDEVALAALSTQVDALLGELQRIQDGLIASGQPQRLKELNQCRVALAKGLADLRSVAARLKGEPVPDIANVALLDVAEEEPGQRPVTYRRDVPKAPERKRRVHLGMGFAQTGAQRGRRRTRWMLAFIVLGGIVAIVARPQGPQPVGLDTFGSPPALVSATVQDGGRKARLVVRAGWRPEPLALEMLRRSATQAGIEAFVITDTNGALVGFSPAPQSRVRLSGPAARAAETR
jgi:hypothetical protein